MNEKSGTALGVTREAADVQGQATADIEKLKRYLESVEKLQAKVNENATQSRSLSQRALDEANILYENGTAPLPDLGTEKLQGVEPRRNCKVLGPLAHRLL